MKLNLKTTFKVGLLAVALASYVGLKNMDLSQNSNEELFPTTTLVSDEPINVKYKNIDITVTPKIGPTGMVANYKLNLKSNDTIELVDVYKENPFDKTVSIDSNVQVFEPNSVANAAPILYETKFNEAPFRRLTEQDLDSIIGLVDKYLKN